MLHHLAHRFVKICMGVNTLAILPPRAITALKPIMLDESRLKRGCSSPFLASPSIVVRICLAKIDTFAIDQDVHAPHWPSSQPFLVPMEMKPFMERIEQRGSHVDMQPVLPLLT